ncbi:MAG: hypothetical protein GXO91_00805 [FCB group bacterium]|nr:hypothetical protein [FCB group bacterium]
MIRKVIIILVLFMAFSFARELNTAANKNASQINAGQNNITVIHNPAVQQSDRTDVILYEDDFEGDVSGWQTEGPWILTEEQSMSPTHSFNAVNNPGGADEGSWNLYSPVYALPELGDGEVMRFGFSLFIDTPDFDGDGDNSLEDLYRVSLADVDALAWHATNFNAFAGMSYWCGDESLQGYSDGWLQFLDTPPITVPGIGYELSAQLKWGIEDPCGGDCGIAGAYIDGWDAANVRISTDGGTTWDFLNGDDPYDFTSGYGWFFNGEPEYTPGWGGQQDWHNVTFDLSAYSGEEVIIRFAFGSDPAYSTIDDASLVGFFVDDITIENIMGDQIFAANADGGDDPMIAAGLAWIEQFYDYGDPAGPRPGANGWEEYLPGYPYNGNVFLDISDMAGKNIQFKFMMVYDGNDDGGSGDGLFIDDFKIYKELGAPPAPTGLAGEALDSQCNLWWDDMNYAGTDDYIYDSDQVTQLITLTDAGEAWAGERFDIVGSSTINTVSVFNANGFPVDVTVAAFEQVGAFYNLTPTYQTDVTLDADWNDLTLGWDMGSGYIIAVTFTNEVAAGLDESNPMGHSMVMLGGNWDTWQSVAEGSGGSLNDGEWGIRANITTLGADVTYNVYRDGEPLASGFSAASYSDFTVENNITYEYAVSATFPSGDESDPSAVIELTPQSSTIYEIALDDGTSELGISMGSGNYMAVKFTAVGVDDDLVRLKWYQQGDGGAFYFYLWNDDAGLPGAELWHHIIVGGVEGWNSYDVSAEGIQLTGDFWLGVKEFSSTQDFGFDTGSNGMGYWRQGGNGDWQLLSDLGFDGNLMVRPLLDGGEVQGCTLGDVNADGVLDVLDIVRVVNFIMGSETPTDDEACAADINEDGVIDVLDIVNIVNIIMGS